MTPEDWWRLLHLFFAFGFVGTLVLADWNGRAARASADWSQRALLFGIVHLATRTIGLASLLMLGLFGNLLSIVLGYRMGDDAWIRWVNGLWLVAVLVVVLFAMPAIARLAALARAGAVGGDTTGYDAALRRWRLINIAISLLYLALLVLMVKAWRS